MKLLNYTPHDPLTYRPPGGEAQVLPQLGMARCREEVSDDGSFGDTGDYPRVRIGYGHVTGLPEPTEDAVYVVSQLVVAALPERDDLAYPAGLVRDDQGSITGFSLLARPA